MNDIILSIIVPVYNVEKYVNICINSVIPQLSSCVELLLIDDGSTDKSGKICDDCVRKADNIHVFHKKNGGLSDARNFGIKKATGKYLLFLDSDDELADASLEYILKAIKNSNDSDVIVGTYMSRFENEVVECGYILNEMNKLSGKKGLEYLINNVQHYDWYAWLNIVKRSYIISNNFFFKVGRYYEDVLWTPYVLEKANLVSFMNTPFYIYRRNREGAITKMVSWKIVTDKLYVCKKIIEFASDKTIKKELIGSLNYMYTSLLAEYYYLKNDNADLDRDMKSLLVILKYSNRTIDRIMYYCGCALGVHFLMKMLYMRRKMIC